MDIVIDKNNKTPIYIQIYEQIKQGILNGELKDNTKLPPERKLADKLLVNRSTILNAYNKLKAEELIGSMVGQGTIVIKNNTIKNDKRIPSWNNIFNSRLTELNDDVISQMFPLLGKKDIISFALGMSDSKLIPQLPIDKLNQEFKKNKVLFSHSPVLGNISLRNTLCNMLSKENISEENIIILSGSQQGIDYLSRILLEPEDIVVVEAPTYFLALESFRSQGAKIIEVPIDENGINMDKLEQIFVKYHPKCIYTIPNHQNPSSYTMNLDRRKKLLSLAYHYDVMIIEDDAYADILFDHKKIPSLFELDKNGYVIYLKSFSKTICSGIRMGFMAADKNIILQCSRLRQFVDIHPNNITEWLLNEFIVSGNYEKHVNEINKTYKSKCDYMDKMLTKYSPINLTWKKPNGGYYFWCKLPDGVKASELIMHCIKENVAFMPGIPFYAFKNGDSFMRLNYTTPTEDEIKKGIEILCNNIRKLSKKSYSDENINSSDIIATL